jgi:hypothetical protein
LALPVVIGIIAFLMAGGIYEVELRTSDFYGKKASAKMMVTVD